MTQKHSAEPHKKLMVLGLFSGIGGFELGLSRAGFEIAGMCEIDPFCRKVLGKHWPGVPIHDDIRTLDGGRYRGVDVVCGGFPCQDISVAGKGAGLEGERSGLWFEYARVIGEARPRYVIVENVAALLGRGLGRVLGDLASLGYDAEWHCIPASAIGAPHRRDRLWIIAYANNIGGRPEQIGQCGGKDSSVAWDDGKEEFVAYAQSMFSDGGDIHGVCDRESTWQIPESGDSGADVPNSMCARLERRSLSSRIQQELANASINRWWASESDVCRVANGVPYRVDRLKSLGNAIVPQIAELIGRAINE